MLQHHRLQISPQAACRAVVEGFIGAFVHGRDDVGHGDLGSVTPQHIAATGPARALHQAGLAQIAENLLQAGKRYLLARADAAQRHGAGLVPQGQVDHRVDGKAAFRTHAHEMLL